MSRLHRTYFPESILGQGDLLVTGHEGRAAVLSYDSRSEIFPRLIARGAREAGRWIRKAGLATGLPQVPWDALVVSLCEYGKIGRRLPPIHWPCVARAYARAIPQASDGIRARWRMKGAGRRAARTLMRRWMTRSVPEADFILEGVDGSLHAFLYDPGREDMAAPVLLCAATGEHTRLLEALADEHGIPVVRDALRTAQIRAESDPLAYAGEECWKELIEVMAELYGESPERYSRWGVFPPTVPPTD